VRTLARSEDAIGGEDAGLTARLARVALATSNSVILMDASGAISWVNDGFTAITGYGLGEAVGQTPCGLLASPETDPDTLNQIIGCLLAGKGHRCEVLLAAKSGRRFWVNLDIQPTLDAQGQPDGFVAIQTEVTSAKALEGRLNATTSALRSAGELAKLGAWEVDLREGVVRWSPELQAMLGRRSEEDMMASLSTYAVEDRDRVRTYLGTAAQAAERIEFEARAFSASGETIWLRVIGEPEMVDGKVVTLRGASQDITAQRLAHAELAESERFGRGVIDGLAAMLTVIDEDGRIIAANKAFKGRGAEITQSAAYPMGRNLFDVLATLPGSHGRALTQGIRAVLSGGRDSFNRAYQAKNGEWFRATAARFAGEGPVRAVVVTQSIEDMKRTERRVRETNARLKRARDDANAASEAKSNFLATMSHEIRTPLNGVLGMAQAMARDELSPVQRERLGVVRQAGETLLALLNDLLDLSRIEAGRLDLEDGVIDLDQMIGGLQATFTTLATEKDVSFGVELAPEARGCWRGDPTRVRQILYNLVSNAVKFTARGSVVVKVWREAPNLVFEVTDTGPGIPGDRLSALFEKFVQADPSTTRRYGGSGLGLSICRHLAGLMGGEVAMRSIVDVGSVFTVRLPLEQTEGAAAGQTHDGAPHAPTQHETSPLRILAAEDNPMNRLVLKTLLAQVGLEVECVADGAEAVAAWEQQSWDAILMDVQMPVMDGPTATRAIRAQEAATGRARTPIIALTANAMAHHQVEYLGAGMDILVPKPLELERLLMAIQMVLDAGEAEAEAATQVA
jgi:PAS domain S-box-containing protein